MPFIDLSRQFRKIGDGSAALADDAGTSDWRYDGDVTYGALTWADVLERPRVVVLAGAGSGKTAELQHQAEQLTRRGEIAFFVELESLAKQSLVDVLGMQDGATERFEAWRSDEDTTAWFFLDSVDEFRLVGGKLDRALRGLARALAGRLDRARVILSSRPHDWYPTADLAALRQHLPVPPSAPTLEIPPDEVFLAPLRKTDRTGAASSQPATIRRTPSTSAASSVLIVELVALNQRQVERFVHQIAGENGLEEPDTFLEEIRRRGAWPFTRRPLDLLELATIWSEHGRLGTRAEQHEASITRRLREKPDVVYHRDAIRLTDDRARHGAERLALALALTRMRTLRSSEQPLDVRRAAGVLDPAPVLPDWSESDRQSLLRRALFDPATYGRTRFYHRSTEEYLAARRLLALRERGLARGTLRRLLFAEQYQTPVVIPSMRPMAAWLALWADDVWREVLHRAPELLLTHGDPAALPLEARATLVRAFARAYGRGGEHGIRISHDAVRGLADPGLAPVVRDLWDEGAHHEDGGELLLGLIEAGPFVACADLAAAALRDMSRDASFRLVAARALVACGRTADLDAVAAEMVADPLAWPLSVVEALIQEVFPRTISAPELLQLVEQLHDPDGDTGFVWALQAVAARVDPTTAAATALRDGLADLIERGQPTESNRYHAASRFAQLAGALAILCERQLPSIRTQAGERTLAIPTAAPDGAVDPNLVAAAAITCYFETDALGKPDQVFLRLRAAFANDPTRRASAFWADVALTDRIESPGHIPHNGLSPQLTASDLPWLEEALVDSSAPGRQRVALHMLLALWRTDGRDPSTLAALASRVAADATLTQELVALTTTPATDAARMPELHARVRRRRDCIERAREQRRLKDWSAWRATLLADPQGAFVEEKRRATIETLHRWLERHEPQRNRHGAWDGEALASAFSPAVRDAAADALRDFWRSIAPPPMWSERPSAERNQYYWDWAYALSGLAAEAQTPGWADRLSPAEVRLGVRIATTEMNGFPAWLDDLAAAHASVVEAVLGDELVAELAVAATEEYLPVLQNLTHASTPLQHLLAPRLHHRVASWPEPEAGVARQAVRSAGLQLEQVLNVLEVVLVGEDRTRLGADCARRHLAQPCEPLALPWLRGVVQFSPGAVAEVIATALVEVPAAERDAWAVNVFGVLFGRHGGMRLDIDDSAQRADALALLMRCAYAHIRRADDQHHRGGYTPNTRDDAQHARSGLLSALLETPGERSHACIIGLSTLPGFEGDDARIRTWARERAASDAERTAMLARDVVTLDTQGEFPPHSRDELFEVMMDRLADLADELAHGDFTDRPVLRRIRKESEMQATLALRLDRVARGAYRVTREEEVADAKRTDIRLLAVRGDQKAVIEIKLADSRWSLGDLEHALRYQVVGQYLRYPESRAGCLLLAYAGEKRYWQHPETGAELSFQLLLEYLRGVAATIERETSHSLRLGIFGLDLADPVLVPAHR